MIDLLLIFKSGLPGNREADILDGIKINVFVIVKLTKIMRQTNAKLKIKS